jgi:phosphate:Na+ symporter
MVLGMAGLVDLQTSVCIMLGDNIGTCITAQLASLTGNINARRTAWAHTLYNVIGVVVAGLFLPIFVHIVQVTTVYLQPTGNISSQIANSHTIFNVLSALIFLPITKYYVKFLENVIKGKDNYGTMYLDKLLLDTPIAAVRASLSEIIRAAEITRGMVINVMDGIITNNEKKLELVQAMKKC